MNKQTWSKLLSDLTPVLLNKATAHEAIQTSLDLILERINVCRVYLFDLHEVADEGYAASQIFESCNQGIEPQIDNPILQNVSMQPDYKRWMNLFLQHKPVVGLIRDFPESERGALEEQNIKSLLILPIIASNKPIAFVGFDDTKTERIWEDYHLETLKEAVILIGSLLIRRTHESELIEHQLKQEELLKKLLVQQKQLIGLTENIRDGIWMRDAIDFKIVFANKTLGELFSISHEQFENSDSDLYLQYIHPSDRDFVAKQNAYHFESKENVTIEFRLYSSDTSFKWVKAQLFTVFDNLTGEPTFHCGVLTDISEQRRQLAVVQEARNRAEELNRVKSNILSNIRHEFRTPLTGIRGFADLIFLSTNDPEINQYANYIAVSCSRLHNTLDALLDYSILDAGLIHANPSWIVIEETIADLVETLTQKLKEGDVKLNLSFSGTNKSVYFDPHIFYTISRQLFDNAIKFTNQGYITINIDVEPELIKLRVADTGFGISEESKHLIFEPFRQCSEGSSRTHEGTGLGLPIVKRYIDLVSGSIKIENNNPAGTIIDVTIPLSPVVELPINGSLPLNQKPTKKRILYVEDNLLLQALIRQSLKDFEIDITGTAEEAIEKVRNNNYGLLLVDINLGSGMNGIDFCKTVRRIESYKNAQIIAVTASNKSEIDQYVGAGGFDNYISKPFNIKQIHRLAKTYFTNETNFE